MSTPNMSDDLPSFFLFPFLILRHFTGVNWRRDTTGDRQLVHVNSCRNTRDKTLDDVTKILTCGTACLSAIVPLHLRSTWPPLGGRCDAAGQEVTAAVPSAAVRWPLTSWRLAATRKQTSYDVGNIAFLFHEKKIVKKIDEKWLLFLGSWSKITRNWYLYSNQQWYSRASFQF